MRAVGPVVLLALAACGSPPTHDRAAIARAPLRVRVMSFNLRWDGFDDGANAWAHRRELVFRVLREFRPDSVGTQEPMKRQIADIEEAIPELVSYRFDNDPKYVRTQQILYRKDRFDRIDGGGFLVAEGTNEDGTVRYCTWVHLEDRATGRRYYHYNVHLDHRSAPSRQASVVRLMAHVAARATNDPFVITGDFNAGERSPSMRFLLDGAPLADDEGNRQVNPIPLVDTFRSLFPDEKDARTGGGFAGRRTGGMIDHVLVERGAARILTSAIDHTNDGGKHPSDHFPVTAVIEWE